MAIVKTRRKWVEEIKDWLFYLPILFKEKLKNR